MRVLRYVPIMLILLVVGVESGMAVEEASYQVLKKEGRFELRDYDPVILAEVVVDGELDEAGSQAFRTLFKYISGDNRSQTEIAMTAPVTKQAAGDGGEEIAMTAPVTQQAAGDRWAVSFTMPAGFTMESIPLPEDPRVSLREVPGRQIASVRYSGFWNKKSYLQHKEKLERWIRQTGLTPVGDAIWARYDPPFKPWFMRRNEVLIPVDGISD